MVLLAWLTWAWADLARADVVNLGTRSGAIEMAVEVARQRIKSANASESRFDTTQTQEHLSLRNQGAYIYDPRLFSFSLGGDFGLSQDRSGGDSGRQYQSGTLWGYDAFAGVLGEQATSLSLFANRAQSLISREWAGRNEALTESRGATLAARRLALPSSFTFRQESQEEESRSGDVLTRREDERNIFTYEGQRGWFDRETSLRYELVDLNATVQPSLSYQSQEGSVGYSADFGAELNKHWDSQVRLFARTGETDLTTLTMNEALRVDHSERLWSESRYFLMYADTMGQASTTHTGTLRLHHKLYESLLTTLGGDVNVLLLPGGEKDILRSQFDFAYTKRLPGRGTLNAGLGGRLEYENDRFNVTESFVPQETHVVATPALPVTLNNPFVVSSSLVVTKTVLGPLPPGCLTPSGPPVPLVLGRDFTLLPVGDAVQIVPISCSGATPGINPGDTITADYRFAVSPSLVFVTDGWRADFSTDYHWVRPYLAHEQRDQHLVSGREDGWLQNESSDAIGIEFRGDGWRVHANLLGELSRFSSDRLTYHQLRSTQFASYSPLPELILSLSMEEGLLDFLSPDHQTRTMVGQANLTYVMDVRLLAECSASTRWLDDTLLPDERNTEAIFRIRWLLRELELTPSFEFFDRRREDTVTREYRMLLRAVRRF